MEQVDWKDFFAQAAVEGVGPTVGKYLNYYRMMFGAKEYKGGVRIRVCVGWWIGRG